jgi:histidine phosphotransferase ChpT
MLFGRPKARDAQDRAAARHDAALPDATGAAALDLAALIASRICHDLISPVGAIGNGVELIEQFGSTGKQEMSLIGDSARTASGMLQFFRLAFASGPPEAPHGIDALRRIVELRYGGERAALSWRVAPGAQTTRLGARLVCFGVMGAAAALPRGGKIEIELGEDAVLRVTATGPMLRLEPNAPIWLAGGAGDAPPAPRDVQWPAAYDAARTGGAALALTQDDAALSFAAALPAPARKA